MLIITALSVLFHTLHISLHWVIAYGFGVEIPFHYLFVTIPFVNILSALPISWNGVGFRESGYIFFLVPQYLTGEQGYCYGSRLASGSNSLQRSGWYRCVYDG